MPPNGSDNGTPLDAAVYYRLRVAVLELALFNERSQAHRATLVARLQAQLRAAGLDPDATYHLEDDGCRAIVAPAGIGDRPASG